MLKDTFHWHACVEEITTTSCGGKVKVSLLGYNDYPFGGGISNGSSGEALAKEIAYCVNNGTRYNTDMDVNSLYPTHPENKEWNDNTDLYRSISYSLYGPRGQFRTAYGLQADNERHLERYIDDVIFNNPATIVKWKDGTKTVVKVQEDDQFDPMVGLAMCIAKKAMGNQGNYFEVFKKWCEPWYEERRIQEFNEDLINANIKEILEKMSSSLDRLKINAQKSPVLGNVINCKEDKNGFTLTLDAGHHCINCRYCMRSDDIYLCVNPEVLKTEIAAPQFTNCYDWEAMPEPKNEGE